jgi:hypothetical protein
MYHGITFGKSDVGDEEEPVDWPKKQVVMTDDT